jgi:hypothetical protein
MRDPGGLRSCDTLCTASTVLVNAYCARCSPFHPLNIATRTVCLLIVYAAVVVIAIVNAQTSFSFNSSAVGSPLQPPSLTINPGYLPQVKIMGHKKHAGMNKTTARHRVSSDNRRRQDVLQAHKQKERKQAGLVQQEEILHGTVECMPNEFVFIASPAGLSYNEREAVKSMYENQAMDIDDEVSVQIDVNSAPPGDEGFDISHAGGEHEVFETLEGVNGM